MNWLQTRLNEFDDDFAVATLTGDEQGKKTLFKELYGFRDEYFKVIINQVFISTEEEQSLCKILQSPLTEECDARLIISAQMIAQYRSFDARRMKQLAKIYCTAPSDRLKQEALVALLVCRPSRVDQQYFQYEIRAVMDLLGTSPTLPEDLLMLQMQLLETTKTKQTQEDVKQNVMPVFRAHIENLDNEKFMDKAEDAMEQMREMQKRGADIYYEGFEHAKRFPFFYTLSNWFMPFSEHHPAVQVYKSEELPTELVLQLMEGQDFCESDKYSFFICAGAVKNQFPPEVIEMLKKGDLVPALPASDEQDGNFYRRVYIQDLYRFFFLYPKQEVPANPFKVKDTYWLWTMEALKPVIINAIDKLLTRENNQKRNLAMVYWLAESVYDLGFYNTAKEYYDRIFLLTNENPMECDNYQNLL